jgi:hypothetical protein
MKLFALPRSLVSTLFHRSQRDVEMEEELRSHIQHRADDLERSGLPRKRPGATPASSSAAMRGSRKNATKRSAAIFLNSFGRMRALAFAYCANLPASR